MTESEYLSLCTGCPLEGKSEHQCLMLTPTPKDIMIVEDRPSYYEDTSGELFKGSASRWLQNELEKLGLDVSDVYYSKAVKCYSSKTPEKAAVKKCREILYREIEIVKPKYILVLGALALDALIGKTNISKHRGKMFEWRGIKVIATLHPGVVMMQPSHLWEWRADLAYFIRMTKGTWRPPDDFKWTIINTLDDLKTMVREVKKCKEIAYDIESTSIKDHRAGKILMIGIATWNMCYIVPWETTYSKLPHKAVVNALNMILAKNEIKKIAQNAKFDNRWLQSRGVNPYLNFDTYLAAYTINNILPHGLKWLSKTLLGASDYDEGIEFKEDLTREEFVAMARYCALDVYYTLRLYPLLKEELEEDDGKYRVFKHIIMPGERVLQKIEKRGVYVDLERLNEVLREYREKLAEAEKALNEALPPTVDWEVNWNSSDQVAKILFEHCGLEPVEYTAGKKPSTSRSVLLRLVDKHEIPRLMLEVRKYSKAISGFLEPWEALLEAEVAEGREPRLYTTYNIAKTATGRLSAEDPNLQQVPRDKNVRSLITAPPGRVLIQADFSQIELKVVAFIARVSEMLKVYREGGDIHTLTACDVTGKDPKDVTKDERTLAKAINFGFVYGMWWKSFKAYAFDSYGVVINDDEARRAREKYFERYHELIPWHERQKREVRALKGVRTAVGRFRHLPNIDSLDRDLSSEAERQAINTPVQSLASDITLISMIIIDRLLEEKFGDTAFLVGQVHDAIMAECDEKDAVEVGRIIKDVMENMTVKALKKYFGVTFDVPIEAEVEIGAWGNGVPLEKYAKEKV